MGISQLIDGLRFPDLFIKADKVREVLAIQFAPLVKDLERHFPPKWYCPELTLDGQRVRIYLLVEPASVNIVYFHARANHGVRLRIANVFHY